MCFIYYIFYCFIYYTVYIKYKTVLIKPILTFTCLVLIIKSSKHLLSQ